MSLAAQTRRAITTYPFLYEALRADVLNVTATARFLDIDGETEAIAGALRRYGDDLPAYEHTDRSVRVRMQRGFGPVADPEVALLACGSTLLGPGDGSLTALIASGDVDASALAAVLNRLALEDIDVVSACVDSEQLLVVVDQYDSATALRTLEEALERVPER